MSRRPRVAVVLGGRSSEHSISCISAGGVLRAIDRERFDVVAVGILPDGRWVHVSDDPEDWTGSTLPTVADTHEELWILPGPTSGVSLREEGPGSGFLSDVDVVFPILHGPWGEDGTVQGVLEMAGLPYVGSGVFASAAAMDKGHMKAMLRAAGLPVGPYELITDHQWRTDALAARERMLGLGFPLFVKPARAGSSVGISRVTGAQDLDAAIELARSHDPRIIAEAAVVGGREIECGVLVDADGVARSSVCAEIRVKAGHDFYDFEAKYLDDGAELIVPADLNDTTSETVRALAVEAFTALDCEGLARVDFFVTDDGVLINELNTMPGFTPISMFPRMWQATGVSYPEIVARLLDDALRRGTGLR